MVAACDLIGEFWDDSCDAVVIPEEATSCAETGCIKANVNTVRI